MWRMTVYLGFIGTEFAPKVKVLNIEYGFDLPGLGPFNQLFTEEYKYPVQAGVARFAPSASFLKITCGKLDRY